MMEMYKKSGEIISKIRKMAINHVKADMKIIDLVEYVESNIIEMGGRPAFPCNISINEITAHYTASPGDESIIKRGDLVKIDLGAHVDGYIADSAASVIVGIDDSEFNIELVKAIITVENDINFVDACDGKEAVD